MLSLYLLFVALPLSSQPAYSADGIASVSYFSNNGVQENFLFGDFTLRSEGAVWGAEFGMFGDVGRLHETYAAATYSTGSGKLSFGFPRPSYDEFATSALTEIMPRLSLKSVGSIRSRTTYGTMNLPKFLPYGVRYSSQPGVLDYTFSFHAVPNYPDIIAGGAVRLEQGPWTFDLAGETVRKGAETQWNTKAEVVREFENVTLGFGVFEPQANNHAAMIEMFGHIGASDHTEITGLVHTTAHSDPVFGLGLSHQVSSHWTFKFGVVGADTRDLATRASLDLQF